MTVSLHHIVIDTHDLPRLARFWSQVLGWRILSEREREVVIGTDVDAAAGICLMPAGDEKSVKNRVHVNLNPGGGRPARRPGSRDQAHPCPRCPACGHRANGRRVVDRAGRSGRQRVLHPPTEADADRLSCCEDPLAAAIILWRTGRCRGDRPPRTPNCPPLSVARTSLSRWQGASADAAFGVDG
jgi:catechol 2,3-dioxygenase-like lactoylglutathione lyase family enzyme